MKTFDISVSQDTVVVRQGDQARLTFTVTNVSGRPVHALVKLVPEDDVHAGWLWLAGESRRGLEHAQTTSVVVEVKPPGEAPPGTAKFRLVVASEENPDEDFAEAVAQFTVTQAAAPLAVGAARRPRRWWIAAGAAVLAAVIVAVAWPESRREPPPPEALPPTAQVPGVIGMGFDEAAATLRDAGFEVAAPESVGGPPSDADERADLRVWKQAPKEAPLGAEVTLTMVPTAYTYGGAGGPGDEEFGDAGDVVKTGPIRKVEVYELDLDDGTAVISGYQLWYGPDLVPGDIHGCTLHPKRKATPWRVPDDGAIVEVEGRIAGGYVRRLLFRTETGWESPEFGKGGQLVFKAPGRLVGPLRTISGCARVEPQPDFMGLPPDQAWHAWWAIEETLAAWQSWAQVPVGQTKPRRDWFLDDPRTGTPWESARSAGRQERVPGWTLMGGLTRLTFHFECAQQNQGGEPNGL